MAIEQNLEIKYLIKAVDEATEVLKKVQSETDKVSKATNDYEKANKSLEKSQKNLNLSLFDTYDRLESLAFKFGTLTRVVAGLDFRLVARQIGVLADLLRFKGAERAANILETFSLRLTLLSPLLTATGKKVQLLQEQFGETFGAIAAIPEWITIYDRINMIVSILTKLGIAVAVFTSIQKAGNVLGIFVSSLQVMRDALISSGEYFSRFNNIFGEFGKKIVQNKGNIDSFVNKISYSFNIAEEKIVSTRKSFFNFITDNNKITGLFTSSIDKMRSSILTNAETVAKSDSVFSIFGKTILKNESYINSFADNTINKIGKVNNVLNVLGPTKYVEGIKSLGSSFFEAAKHSELMEKGLFGLTTRLTSLASLFSFVGINLIQMDSIFAKLAGTTLLALTAALGGVALIIKQVLSLVGDFIFSIGTSLTKSMQHSTEVMAEQQKQTFAFKYVIDSLNESLGDGIGTFDEWNDRIYQFSMATGFSVGETQQAVTELVQLGNAFGLNRQQMEKLLPVIGDLAVAQHKDLFTATLAVTEAVGGQTQMLKNMGIDVSNAGLQHSKLNKELTKSIDKLDQHTQGQLRYNGIIQKTSYLNNLANESLQTLEGSTRKLKAEMQNMNAELGKGANLIETRFQVTLSILVSIFRELSPEMLQVIGFVTSLGGRALQITGIFTQWAFSIVFLISAISSLNQLLKNKIIANWIILLSQAEVFTKANNTAFGIFVRTVGEGLAKIGEGTLKFTSIFQILIKMVKSLTAALIPLLLSFARYTLILTVITTAIYAVYDALKRVDAETKVFSKAWDSLISFLKDTSILDYLKAAFKELANYLAIGVKWSIEQVATATIYLMNIFNELQIWFIKVKATVMDFVDAGLVYFNKGLDWIISKYELLKKSITESSAFIFLSQSIDYIILKFKEFTNFISSSFSSLFDSIKKVKDKILEYVPTFDGVKKGIMGMLGMQSLYAQETTNLNDEILKIIESHGKLSKAQIAYSLGIKDQKDLTDKFVKSLESTNYQMIQDQLLQEKSQGIIDNITKSKKALTTADRENIVEIQKSIKSNELALVRLKEKLWTEQKITKEVKKNAQEHIKAGLTQQDVLNKVNSVLSKIKMGFEEQVIFNFSVEDVRNALTQTVNKIDEIKNKVKNAKDEELPAFMKELQKLQENAIQIEFIGQVSGGLGIVDSLTKGSAAFLKTTAQAVGAAFGPMGALIGSVVGQLIDVFGKSPEEFRKLIMDTLKGVPDLIIMIIENIAIVLPDVIEKGLMAIMDRLPDILSKVMEAFISIMLNPFFWSKISWNVAWAFVRVIPQMVEGIVRGIRDGFNNISKTAGKATSSIEKAIKDIKEWWKNIDWKKTWEEIKKGFVTGMTYALLAAFAPFVAIYKGIEYIVNHFDQIVKSFKEAMIDVGNFFSGIGEIIYDAIVAGVTYLVEALVGFFNAIVEMFKQIPEFVVQFFVSLYEFFKNLGTLIYDVFKPIVDAIVKAFEVIYKFFTKDLIKFFADVFKGIGKFFEPVGTALADAGKGFYDVIVNSAKFFFEKIKQALTGAYKTVTGGGSSGIPLVGGLIDAGSNFISSIFGKGGIPALPSLAAANGLIVPGQQTQGDRVPVRVNSREMILTLDQQARLFKLIQGELSQGQQRPIEIQTRVELDSRELGRAIDKLDANGWRK